MYKFDFTGKTAIVTGGAEGFGEEFSTTLAEQGADVAIFDIRYELACETAEKIHNKTDKKVIAYKCDISQEGQVKSAVAAVVKEFGKIDMLVNNAGKLTYAPIEEHTLEMWREVIDVDLTGPWLVTREVVLQAMKKQGKGRVVNIASISGMMASNLGNPSYAAAKAGVMGLTREQAVSFGPLGILVNAISPGTFVSGGMSSRTKFASHPEAQSKGRNPLKRPGVYGELSGALIYFLSDENTYTNGQTLAIDGGLTSAI